MPALIEGSTGNNLPGFRVSVLPVSLTDHDVGKIGCLIDPTVMPGGLLRVAETVPKISVFLEPAQ